MTPIRLTLDWVARAVGGVVRGGDAWRELGDVVIDSRVVQEGDVFVAIRGPRFDAHDFVPDVVAKGAAAVIVESGVLADLKAGLYNAGDDAGAGDGGNAGESDRGDDDRSDDDHRGRPSGRPETAFIEVGDTLKALQDLAHAVRRDAATRVIAITGSAGKTTTKETIAAFLGGRFRVVKNEGNLNNHIGLPLSLMQLRERPDVAVMELGMNHAGEISALVAIAEPDVRVWTNVGDAHLGFFDSPEAIADAKAEILEQASADTLLVCNADDPRVMARARGFVGRTITFGTSRHADVRAAAVEDRGLNGVGARVVTWAGEQTIETPLLGRGNLANVLAATVVALDAGVPLPEIAAAAARLTPADRRGAVRPLRDGIMLVDDSYNSSPDAVRRVLDVVARESRVNRKVAVLGEMLELGDHAARLHAEIGRAAAGAGLELLVAIGGDGARELARAAVSAGMPADAVRYYENSGDAAAEVVRAVRAGDLILVKGSRGIRTDLVVDRIAAEFA